MMHSKWKLAWNYSHSRHARRIIAGNIDSQYNWHLIFAIAGHGFYWRGKVWE